MPIRAELREFYGREWREIVRPRILRRAGNCCEQCLAPNLTEATRVRGCWLEQRVSWKDGVTTCWRAHDGSILLERPPGRTRRVRIVLTIAHLNHVAGDDRDDNLKALCQWCHLNYDKHHHAETRATRKDRERPLLKELYV